MIRPVRAYVLLITMMSLTASASLAEQRRDIANITSRQYVVLVSSEVKNPEIYQILKASEEWKAQHPDARIQFRRIKAERKDKEYYTFRLTRPDDMDAIRFVVRMDGEKNFLQDTQGIEVYDPASTGPDQGSMRLVPHWTFREFRGISTLFTIQETAEN